MKLDFLENMTIDEKLSLVDEIWVDIHKDYIDLSVRQAKELDERIERIEKGEATFYSINEVFEKLRKKRA